MKKSLIWVALIGLSLSGANAVDLVESMQLSADRCDDIPGAAQAHVIVTLFDWKPLTDSGLILKVLNAGRDFAKSRCADVKTISVFVRAKNSDPFEIAATWQGGDQWNVSINRVPYLMGLEGTRKPERQHRERD